MPSNRVHEIALTLQRAIHRCANDLPDSEYLDLLEEVADRCSLDAEAWREEDFRGKDAPDAGVSVQSEPGVGQALCMLLTLVVQRPEVLQQLVAVAERQGNAPVAIEPSLGPYWYDCASPGLV
jgi:hypothetical protein